MNSTVGAGRKGAREEADGLRTRGSHGTFGEMTLSSSVVRLGSVLFAAWVGASPAMAGASSTLERAHAHNDYEQSRPLEDALSHGFASVEADIWYVGRELLVAHERRNFRGTLRELYLDPLQRLVDRNGSVYGDGKPFYLWVDLKENTQLLRNALFALLERYPMLSVFSETQVVRRPVTVILTGNDLAKRMFMREHPIRRATRDSNQMMSSDPAGSPTWSWYALNWSSLSLWRGVGRMPEWDRMRLNSLAQSVRARGRRLRIYGAPDIPEYWKAAHDAQVDLIGTDRLGALGDFLRQLPASSF